MAKEVRVFTVRETIYRYFDVEAESRSKAFKKMSESPKPESRKTEIFGRCVVKITPKIIGLMILFSDWQDQLSDIADTII